jgi:predicted O-linked N-acetylglucosamine transferase (SPINDLY family)
VDEVSARLRSHAARWRNIAGRPDSVVEKEIRSDAPDVVVDLAGHTGQNRLALFERRLAPVQIAYLGYPNTTGVPAIDFRFTDATADPVGTADALFTERLVRFSTCAWTYAPPAEAVEIDQAPAGGGSSAPSFGSFNNLCKVNDFTLRLWARVLAASPGSRLVLKSLGLEPERVMGSLSAAGIDPSRVSLLQPEPGFGAHLAAYRHIDVALDPFPYCGTTTTCEALWMGRPVVTLKGDRHASRVGASLLGAVGRSRWIAHSPEDYVRIAVGLASDREALRSESAALRAAMEQGALLDHRGQARRFGHALRRCWTQWCEGGLERGEQASEADQLLHA